MELRIKHMKHLRHKTLLRTHAKSEFHILDQMGPDELSGFADRHDINIVEEKKIGHDAVLNKVMNDPLILKMRKDANLC